MNAALHAYLDLVRARPFAWGTHDCLIFTNACWRSVYGFGWADDWMSRYHEDGRPRRREALQREFGFMCVRAAIDARLNRVIGTPPRGALVSNCLPESSILRLAFGFSLGDRAVFVGRDQLYFDDIGNAVVGWVN